MVKTINRIEKKTLKRYQVKVKKNNGDFTKLICFGTDSIGYKPKIETIRLNRLCKAFNIAVTRIDNQEGQIGLLIGLKCQSLQASRVAKFESQKYPELGIYESEATDGYIFVKTRCLTIFTVQTICVEL